MIGTRILIECTPALLKWLSSEYDKSFPNDLSIDLQTFMYQQLMTKHLIEASVEFGAEFNLKMDSN